MSLAEPEVYSRLAALYTARQPVQKQKDIFGLFLTAGVANQYRQNLIDENQARERIKAITESGTIPDPMAVKAINDALTGAINVPNGAFSDGLTEGFTLFGIIGAPLFATPAGAITVGLISNHGDDLVKFINTPGNALTGPFLPPRPNSILLTGAVAFGELSRILKQEETLHEIYKEVIPQTTFSVKILEPDGAEQLAASLGGELQNQITSLLSAGSEQVNQRLDELETGIYARLDGLENTTQEILTILNEERDARQRQLRMEEVRQREKFIQQEITGAINLVDSFTRFVIGDADKARKITGCLQAAQTTYQLFSSFVAGSLGPLGFAGGIVGVMQNVFGLFGGGQDPVMSRLDQIEKKLERITELLIEGFQHIDKRLNDVLNLAQRILNEVVINGQIIQARLRDIESKIDHLTDISLSAARAQFEQPVIDLASFIRDQILARESLQPTILQNLSLLANHARIHSRRIEMNGGLINPDPAGISALLERSSDIRTVIGNLSFVVSAVNEGINIPDRDLPDIKHWSYVLQGILELLVIVPDLSQEVAKSHLVNLWAEGNKVKASVLLGTNQDLLLSALDRYEIASIREHSNAGIINTLDELVREIMDKPIGNTSIDKHISDMVLLIQAPFFMTTGVSFRFLLSVMTWRISDIGDTLSINPRAIDLVTDKHTLITYLIDTLSLETGELTEDREGLHFFKAPVKKTVVTSLSQKIVQDIKKLRASLPGLTSSMRVRDVDEALTGIHAVALSRSIALDAIQIPLLRIPPREEPGTVYETDYTKLTNGIKALCMASDSGFEQLAGDAIAGTAGLCKLKNPPIGLTGVVLPKDASGNAGNKRTHVRLFLPAPLNWQQGLEQIQRYEDSILGAFDRITNFPVGLLPAYVRKTDAAVTVKQSFKYYSRPIGQQDTASEIALILRERKTAPELPPVPGKSLFSMELWVFTRISGAILQ